METLIRPKSKLKIASVDNSTRKLKEKSNISNFSLDFKFYQKLFLIFFVSCSFLLFPESPQKSEVLCEKYHPSEACIVW